MIDSEPLWWRVEKELAGEHGAVWTDAQAESCTGRGLPHLIGAMQAAFSLPLDADAGVAWLVDRFIAHLADLRLKPGCVELLDAGAAAAMPMAVASSSPARLIDAVLTRFALRSRFAACVSGEQVSRPKPAPDIFLAAASALSLTAERCVVLEDSLAGVRAGVAAGAQVIAVPEGDGAAFAELTAHVVADLHQARALLALG